MYLTTLQSKFLHTAHSFYDGISLPRQEDITTARVVKVAASILAGLGNFSLLPWQLAIPASLATTYFIHRVVSWLAKPSEKMAAKQPNLYTYIPQKENRGVTIVLSPGLANRWASDAASSPNRINDNKYKVKEPYPRQLPVEDPVPCEIKEHEPVGRHLPTDNSQPPLSQGTLPRIIEEENVVEPTSCPLIGRLPTNDSPLMSPPPARNVNPLAAAAQDNVELPTEPAARLEHEAVGRSEATKSFFKRHRRQKQAHSGGQTIQPPRPPREKPASTHSQTEKEVVGGRNKKIYNPIV